MESGQDGAQSASMRKRPYGRIYGDVWDPAERSWTVLLHLSAFLFPVIPPVLIWLVLRRKSDMLDHHGKRAANFHFSFLLYDLILLAALWWVAFTVSRPGTEESDQVGAAFLFVTALIVLLIISVIWIVLTIDAAIHAGRGDSPGYFFAIPFIR